MQIITQAVARKDVLLSVVLYNYSKSCYVTEMANTYVTDGNIWLFIIIIIIIII